MSGKKAKACLNVWISMDTMETRVDRKREVVKMLRALTNRIEQGQFSLKVGTGEDLQASNGSFVGGAEVEA